MNHNIFFDTSAIFAETEHYLLRQIQPADASFYKELAHTDIPAFLQNISSTSITESIWEGLLENDYLICSILTKDTNTFCGFCQLQWLDSSNPEMGINLLPAFQKQGVALEVLPAFLSQTKKLLPIDYFYSKVDWNNLPSQKLAEKLGGVCIGKKNLLPADFPKDLIPFAEKEFPNLFYLEYHFRP